jgi:hypothetical protein
MESTQKQEKCQIKFIEELDYKMEMDDSETKHRETKIINDDP